MAKWNKMIYTEDGRKLLANVAAGTCQVEFVRAEIGDGTYSEEEKTEQKLSLRTQLKNERNSYGFSSIKAEGNTAYLKVALQNTDVDTAYFVNELGVFARKKGSSEEAVLVLIAVAEIPDYFPEKSNAITIVQNIAIEFANAKQLSIADDMGAYALVNTEYSIPETLQSLVSGENMGIALGKLAKAVEELILTRRLYGDTTINIGRSANSTVGNGSTAEGSNTTASGNCSHAEGNLNTASGDSSHAEGYGNTASGDSSHAEGISTISKGAYQHVEGKYNIEDTSNKYAHIIGNGTPTKRSNAHTVDWDGNAWYSGGMDIEGEDGLTLRDTIGNEYPPRIFTSGRSLILTSASHNSKNTHGPINQFNPEGAGLEISSCAEGIMPMVNYKGTYDGNYRFSLGDSSRPFGTIYCTQTSSDRKIKKDIENLSESDLADKYVKVLDLINFVKFRWKHNMNGGMETPPSSRYHYGIIAQEIEKLLKDTGIGTYDNGIIKADFFAKNTSNAFITGGYREQFENEENGVTYDYSKNTYDFKKGNDYSVYNEILDKELSALNCCGGYNDRNNIGYLMIEDNSKLSEKYEDRPPVTIKGIILIDKDGNTKKLSIDFDKCVSYYEWNDENLSNPKTSGTLNEDGSVTVSFNKKYSTYMIKVDDFNFFDYERIVLDVDYVGEYKVYLIPNATEEHVNANVYDRDRVDDIMLTYHVDYQELQILCLHALKEKSRKQERELADLRKEIEELKGLVKNA